MKLKIIGAMLLSLCITTSSFAQDKKKERKSPPAMAEAQVGKAKVTINYSQPSVKGRTVFGDLVPYDKVWRTGANEATIIVLSADVTINGKTLAAGTYSLFTIPTAGDWTIIFNNDSEQWGAYGYKKKKDALRITAKQSKNEATEKMTISIDEKTGMVHLDWATTRVSFEIKG